MTSGRGTSASPPRGVARRHLCGLLLRHGLLRSTFDAALIRLCAKYGQRVVQPCLDRATPLALVAPEGNDACNAAIEAALDCSLAESYCYEYTYSYNGYDYSYVSFETGDACVDEYDALVVCPYFDDYAY